MIDELTERKNKSHSYPVFVRVRNIETDFQISMGELDDSDVEDVIPCSSSKACTLTKDEVTENKVDTCLSLISKRKSLFPFKIVFIVATDGRKEKRLFLLSCREEC